MKPHRAEHIERDARQKTVACWLGITVWSVGKGKNGRDPHLSGAHFGGKVVALRPSSKNPIAILHRPVSPPPPLHSFCIYCAPHTLFVLLDHSQSASRGDSRSCSKIPAAVILLSLRLATSQPSNWCSCTSNAFCASLGSCFVRHLLLVYARVRRPPLIVASCYSTFKSVGESSIVLAASLSTNLELGEL